MKNTFKILLIFLIAQQGLAATISSKIFDLSKATSKVEFVAVGYPSALEVHGKTTGERALTGLLKFKDSKVEGEAFLDLSLLDTGIDLRNRHMKEKYLKIDQFPKASFKLSQLSLSPNSKDAPFEGTLNLHGQSKTVNGKASLDQQGPHLQASFQFSTQIPHYGIEIPSFMGITIAETVNVSVNFQGDLEDEKRPLP